MSRGEVITLIVFCAIAYILGLLTQRGLCRQHEGNKLSRELARLKQKPSPFLHENRRRALERIAGGTTRDPNTGVRVITKEEFDGRTKSDR